MKKWMIGVATSAILIPTLVLGWHFIIQPWILARTLPPRVEVLEIVRPKLEQHQDKLDDLVREQEGRLERQEEQVKHQSEINKLTADNLKEQIAIIKDMKKP